MVGGIRVLPSVFFVAVLSGYNKPIDSIDWQDPRVQTIFCVCGCSFAAGVIVFLIGQSLMDVPYEIFELYNRQRTGE